MVVNEQRDISITTDDNEENKIIIENFLNENNINFTYEITKKKCDKLYKKCCIIWGLLPFTDDFLVKYIKYYIPKEHKDLFCKTFNLPINKQNWVHFNITNRPKFTYTYQKKYIPNYPIYVISHKRYNKKDCLTVKNLELLGLSYYICIRKNQQQEYEKFFEEQKYNNGNILIIDITDEVKGGTTQRNFCWKHSVSHGHKKFWLLDDNMDGWFYFNELQQVKMTSPLCFTLLEDIIDNTQNVGIISHNYIGDIPSCEMRPPLQHNCKNYSSMLINTELLDKHNIKFRLLYNEDVDLTLQILSKGLNTLGTNIILTDKMTTGSCKGGNEEIYGNVKSNDNKFLDKFNCLFNEWSWLNDRLKNTITMTTHTKNKIPHHKLNYKKITKIFNLKEVKPLRPHKKLKSYEDFAITMIM